jgi:hypothetical protein
MKKGLVFLASGFLAGIASAEVGLSQPTVLVLGVGLFFFIAVLIALALTNNWSHLRPRIWGYFVAMCLSAVTYFVAFLTFIGTAGYAPQVLGLHSSADVIDFGTDVLLGLLAASVVASLGMELLVYILTRRWSNLFLAFFLAASAASLVGAYVIRGIVLRFVHGSGPLLQYWISLGALLAVGEALFCAVLGAQILKNPPQGGASLE